jgi:hypothetical protein
MNIIEESEEKNDLFKLEKILDRKWEKDEVFYKIKWFGYDDDQALWIPLKNLKGFDKEIQEFEEKDIKRSFKQEQHKKVGGGKKEKKKNTKKSEKKSKRDKELNINAITLASTEKSNEEEKVESTDKTAVLKKKRRLERMIDNIIDLSKDQSLGNDKTKNSFKEENQLKLDKSKSTSSRSRETKESYDIKEPKEIKVSNDNKITFDEVPGSIEKDIPLKILYVKSIKDKNKNNHIKFLIQWSQNKNGSTPDPSYVNYEVIKEKFPKILLDYIETKINIADL